MKKGKDSSTRELKLDASELQEHLFDVLSSAAFDHIQNLPSSSQAIFGRWLDTEQARVESWFSGQHEVSDTVAELAEILNATEPNKQAALGWLNVNKQQITIDLLMSLVSETRIRAVADSMAQKTKSRQQTFKDKREAAIRLWREEYEPRPNSSKNKYAAEIAAIVGLQEKTVRGYLTKA